MTDFELAPQYKAIQAEAQVVADAVEPLAIEADAMSTVHDGVLQILRDSKLCELLVPKAYGGRFDQLDPLAIALVREVLMATSSHVDSLFALQGIGSYALSMGGSDAQKQQWLPKVATGEVLAAIGLTEPVAGSDLKNITTALTETDGGWLLNGEKAFISNGGAAGFYGVLARDGDGHTMVLLPADRSGLSTTPTPEIAAPHVLADLQFNDIKITEADIVGERGKGFDYVLATLAIFRVSVAGASLGLGAAALTEAARHAGTREQFGRPLARQGAIAEMLADSWAELEAARLLTYRAASLARADPAAALHHSSAAKLLASETAGKVVDRAVQIMGRWGLLRDSKIERLTRQARPMRIYEGGSQVLRLGISRELVQSTLRATEEDR